MSGVVLVPDYTKMIQDGKKNKSRFKDEILK
jgi:hypothetical protein